MVSVRCRWADYMKMLPSMPARAGVKQSLMAGQHPKQVRVGKFHGSAFLDAYKGNIQAEAQGWPASKASAGTSEQLLPTMPVPEVNR